MANSTCFAAADFDELYDCPLLMGELERIDFEVQGIPHAFVGRTWARLTAASSWRR